MRTLIHSGDLEHLEKVVLDGHGHKLLHETSALEKVTKFIYALPDFMVTKKYILVMLTHSYLFIMLNLLQCPTFLKRIMYTTVLRGMCKFHITIHKLLFVCFIYRYIIQITYTLHM